MTTLPLDFAAMLARGTTIARAGYATEEQAEATRAAEEQPQTWLARYFPSAVEKPLAPHHLDLWAWVWSVRPGHRPPPFVAIWPRGGAKSTSSELAVVALGARRARRYVLYIGETQEQANKHLADIARRLESPDLGRDYPGLGNRQLSKYGHSRGWKTSRLITASGFTVEALGLDTAARGFKVEDQRPDLIVVDDIDGGLDTPAITQKKITTLTRALMPSGSVDAAFLGVQNLIHPDSVFAQLADGRADFLADRIMSGPIPALRGMEYEQTEAGIRLTAGTPSWAGQDREACQRFIGDWGLRSFLAEAQHEVEAPAGGMFDHLEFARCDWADLPSLIRTVVWCDPAVTNKDSSDAHGIQADGLGVDGKVYRLWSWERRASPQDVLERAILKAYEIHAEHVGVETDQGGDTWESVYREALRAVLAAHPDLDGLPVPAFTSDKAGAGHGPKAHRASKMLVDYEHAMVVHVRGTHEVLERALRRFPKSKPFDLVDAAYWAWRDLAEVDTEQLYEWNDRVSIGPNV